MQYLTFKLGEIEFAVEVGAVETVVDYAGVTPVPSRLAYVRGVMDLRGRTVVVMDLREKFGLAPRERAASSRVIVLTIGAGKGKKTIGGLVDDVSEVVSIAEDVAVHDDGERFEFWRRYVRGIARVDGRLIVLLDAADLFSAAELAKAEERVD